MSEVKSGQTVNVHYVGTLDDGTIFDSSRDRGAPLSFIVDSGNVIPGFNNAISEMSIGETRTFAVTPDMGYGDPVEEAVQKIPKANFPPDMPLVEGATVQGMGPQGPVSAVIKEYDEDGVTLDFNHPMAGKILNFEVELLSVEESETSETTADTGTE